jgi:hypothetical protein
VVELKYPKVLPVVVPQKPITVGIVLDVIVCNDGFEAETV